MLERLRSSLWVFDYFYLIRIDKLIDKSILQNHLSHALKIETFYVSLFNTFNIQKSKSTSYNKFILRSTLNRY